MGEIIAFKPGARRALKPAGAAPGGAQILFFLGVRYMRLDDAEMDRLARRGAADRGRDSPGGGGKRKRRARA